jgi:general secretion pathway protein D
MASILQAIPKEGSNTSGAGKEAAVVSGDITIAADKATNSLIIFADSADYAVIEDIIQKLDTPRSMVHIEVLIMEVSVDKQFDLGINWSVFEDTEIGGDSAIVGGGFNPAGVSSDALLSSTGGAIGVISGALQITTSQGTQIVPNMGALITALDKNNDIHILQKPNLTATDNEEASIEVGKKVPYQTRTSTTDNETYNSYDYQSVGLTLKITPHIGEGRNVRLDIYTELSALTTDAVTTTPTTRNRIVDTTVIVQDQNMLVIGGLIDDNTDKSVSKVPLLGSIPILGRLFQYEKHQSTKTNLYIFITPRVVKNDSEANRLTREIQDNMTPEETEIIELYGPLEGRESITLPHTTEPSE